MKKGMQLVQQACFNSALARVPCMAASLPQMRTDHWTTLIDMASNRHNISLNGE
jgi:hypothetical protein